MRLLLTALALVTLVACGGQPPTATPDFARYTVDDVMKALAPLGITDVTDPPRDPNNSAPNTASAHREFVIPSIAPKGGQFFTFAAPGDLEALKVWYARFPDLAPYVYVHGNVLLQINNTLPKAEAERYKAALEQMR